MTISKPALRPVIPAVFLRPLRQDPGLDPQPLSTLRSWAARIARASGKARLKRAIELTREVLEVPADYLHRHRSGLRYGCGRNGHVVAAGRARRRHAGLGKLRRGLGHRCGEAAEAQGRAQAAGALWRACRISPASISTTMWSSPGTARPRACAFPMRLDSGRSRGPDHLRCDLGCLRAGPRFRQARCGDLLLAEGAGRRGRAWRAHPRRPARWSGSRAIRRPGRCPRSSA